jgi:stage IV sporulation protein FB
VFLAEPSRTPWDLHFQIFSFPVRVHPLFWLAGLLLGFSGGENAGIHLLIWLVALFSSILIHELGHALMIRYFGREAHIVLYLMGGLAIEGRPQDHSGFSSFEPYTSYQPRARTAEQQIAISAAGPGIQFLLAGLIVAGVYAAGGFIRWHWLGLFPVPIPILPGALATNPNVGYLVATFLWVNTFWPVMNLLPVLPLDGGQIAMQLLIRQDPWQGMQRALWLSVIVGGGAAIFGLMVMHDMYVVMLFASLALSSYMSIQQTTGGGRPW